VAVNTCLDSLRRRKNHVSLRELREIKEPFASIAGQNVEVVEALRQLKPRDRAMFLLRDTEGLNDAEITLALGCTVETVPLHPQPAVHL
jgi:DNA-directed RNA polymerase specialized sigma24 family protein